MKYMRSQRNCSQIRLVFFNQKCSDTNHMSELVTRKWFDTFYIQQSTDYNLYMKRRLSIRLTTNAIYWAISIIFIVLYGSDSRKKKPVIHELQFVKHFIIWVYGEYIWPIVAMISKWRLNQYVCSWVVLLGTPIDERCIYIYIGRRRCIFHFKERHWTMQIIW